MFSVIKSLFFVLDWQLNIKYNFKKISQLSKLL